MKYSSVWSNSPKHFSSSVISSFQWNHRCFVETSEQASGQRNVEIALCWNQCVCAPEALLRLSHSSVIFILCRHTRLTSLKDPPLFFLTLHWTLLERFLENYSIAFSPQIACYSVYFFVSAFCTVEYLLKKGQNTFCICLFSRCSFLRLYIS